MFEIINNTSNKLVDIDILKVEEYIKFICKIYGSRNQEYNKRNQSKSFKSKLFFNSSNMRIW